MILLEVSAAEGEVRVLHFGRREVELAVDYVADFDEAAQVPPHCH